MCQAVSLHAHVDGTEWHRRSLGALSSLGAGVIYAVISESQILPFDELKKEPIFAW